MDEIKTYLKELIEDATGSCVDDDTMLFEEEILDSMSILYLIGEMESHFDIDLPPDEVVESNYGTVNAMAEYIESKL
ncbi:MAG: phosphopantetheine-binding protein [Lachnospiraceae bacterium]|nr:phosphopantetheine-binding protein [Lachnospiraceae bacterium]